MTSRLPGAGQAPATGGALLSFDGDEMRTKLARDPFVIRHHLADHPLFGLDPLAALAQRLPASSVEYNAGSLRPHQDPALTPRNGLSVDETVRRIRENDSWMVLKNVEQDPAYRALLDACLDELRGPAEEVEPGMTGREGFVFISSPHAVTPFHMDPEQNFLLQVSGHKWVHQWRRADRTVISEAHLERFFSLSPQRNLPYEPGFEASARVFELVPGLGLHFPSMAPHWVQNGDQPSVSFSITFRTRRTIAASAVYRANGLLRRYGLRPRPPGTSRAADLVKLTAVRILDRVRSPREATA